MLTGHGLIASHTKAQPGQRAYQVVSITEQVPALWWWWVVMGFVVVVGGWADCLPGGVHLRAGAGVGNAGS